MDTPLSRCSALRMSAGRVGPCAPFSTSVISRAFEPRCGRVSCALDREFRTAVDLGFATVADCGLMVVCLLD